MEGADRAKETRTAEELERMILQDLRNVDGCPERGVSVTVDGIPRNAMLMFGAEVGPVCNKAELKKLFEVITEHLQGCITWPRRCHGLGLCRTGRRCPLLARKPTSVLPLHMSGKGHKRRMHRSKLQLVKSSLH
jgi:hypothetical protein